LYNCGQIYPNSKGDPDNQRPVSGVLLYFPSSKGTQADLAYKHAVECAFVRVSTSIDAANSIPTGPKITAPRP